MELLENLFEHSGNLIDIGWTISHQTWFVMKESLREIYKEPFILDLPMPQISSTEDWIIDVYWKTELFHALISFSWNEASDWDYSIMNFDWSSTAEWQFTVENFLLDFNTFCN